MTEGVAVEELSKPVKEADQASQNTEHRVPNSTADPAFLGRLSPCNRAEMPHKLDDGENQASEADRTKAVGKCPAGGTTRRLLREIMRAEIPRAVDARDDGVDGILEPLRDPVHCESDKDYQPNDLGMAAAPIAAGRIAAGRLEFGIDGHQCDGVICPEGSRNQTADKAYQINMAVFLADVDGSFEHQRRERDPLYPRPETKGHEQAED